MSHQLTGLQRVDQLGVLTGQDGSSQVEHDAHGGQQHEESDLQGETRSRVRSRGQRAGR